MHSTRYLAFDYGPSGEQRSCLLLLGVPAHDSERTTTIAHRSLGLWPARWLLCVRQPGKWNLYL